MTEITAASLEQDGTTVTLNAVQITKPKPSVLGRMQVSGGTEIVQHIGHRSKIITLAVTLEGTDKDTDKANLESMRDSGAVATYNDSEEGDVDVFVDCDFPHIGGTEPVFYKGRVVCTRAD